MRSLGGKSESLPDSDHWLSMDTIGVSGQMHHISVAIGNEDHDEKTCLLPYYTQPHSPTMYVY